MAISTAVEAEARRKMAEAKKGNDNAAKEKQAVELIPQVVFEPKQSEASKTRAKVAEVFNTGRRNITTQQRDYLLGVRYRQEKKAQGGDRKSEKSSAHFEHLKTAEKIARQSSIFLIESTNKSAATPCRAQGRKARGDRPPLNIIPLQSLLWGKRKVH